MTGCLKPGCDHGGNAIEQEAGSHDFHSGNPEGKHVFRSSEHGQYRDRKQKNQGSSRQHQDGNPDSSAAKRLLHTGGISSTVIEPHNRQTALNQTVDSHDDQLLNFKICTEKSDCRGGISDQEQVDKCHHKSTQHVHDKRRKSQGKYLCINRIFHVQSVYLCTDFLFRSKEHDKGEDHGKRIPGYCCNGRACDTQLRQRPHAEDQERIQDEIDDYSGDLKPHRSDHIAGGLQHFLDSNMDHVGNLHKRTDAHVLDR